MSTNEQPRSRFAYLAELAQRLPRKTASPQSAPRLLLSEAEQSALIVAIRDPSLMRPQHEVHDPAALAKKIHAAAALMKAGGRAPEKPAPDSLAGQILAAAALRDRGGREIRPPPIGSVAEQIIRAGERRRQLEK